MVALTVTVILGVCGTFLTVFLSVRSDLQKLQDKVEALNSRVQRIEADATEHRKQLEAWSARRFGEACPERNGTYDGRVQTCTLPDGTVVKFEPPYLP